MVGSYTVPTLTEYIFSNSNGVSFGTNGSTVTATVKTDYLTTAMASDAGSRFVNTSAGLNLTNISATFNSNSISLSVANAAVQSNQTMGIYASSNTYLTSSGTVDARSMSFRGDKSITVGISAGEVAFSVGAYLTTARGSTDAIGLNTAGTNITWTANSSGLSINAGGYAGTNTATTGAISVTLNTSGISLNIGAYLTTADLSQNSSKYIQNWKLSGNTAGTTSSAQGTDLWLAGGNGVTLSGSSNTISFSVATNYQSTGNYLTTADLSQNSSKYVQNWKLTGNTAGTTSSAQGTDLWFSGGNSITVSGISINLCAV